MTQEVKQLLCRYEDMSLNTQNHVSWMWLHTSCNPRAPTGRWEEETESSEACRLAGIKQSTRQPTLRLSDFSYTQTFPYTQEHTCIYFSPSIFPPSHTYWLKSVSIITFLRLLPYLIYHAYLVIELIGSKMCLERSCVEEELAGRLFLRDTQGSK